MPTIMKKNPRKRHCKACGKWFLPHKFAHTRQQYCPDPACQRERRRRYSARWHAANPHWDAEQRLRARIQLDASHLDPGASPRERICWPKVCGVASWQVAAIIEEVVAITWQSARDAALAKGALAPGNSPEKPRAAGWDQTTQVLR